MLVTGSYFGAIIAVAGVYATTLSQTNRILKVEKAKQGRNQNKITKTSQLIIGELLADYSSTIHKYGAIIRISTFILKHGTSLDNLRQNLIVNRDKKVNEVYDLLSSGCILNNDKNSRHIIELDEANQKAFIHIYNEEMKIRNDVRDSLLAIDEFIRSPSESFEAHIKNIMKANRDTIYKHWTKSLLLSRKLKEDALHID